MDLITFTPTLILCAVYLQRDMTMYLDHLVNYEGGNIFSLCDNKLASNMLEPMSCTAVLWNQET